VSARRSQTSVFDSAVARVVPLVPHPIVRRLAAPYVAGTELPDAVRAVQALNREGLLATVNILGEQVAEPRTALAAAEEYLQTLAAIHQLGLRANVSLKPSGLGSKLSWSLAGEQIERVVTRAEELGCFVRLDMEDAPTATPTLELYRRLRAAGHQQLGVVLQARLWRSVADVAALAALTPNVRLCKGIYLEPPRIAMQDAQAIRASFVALLRRLLGGGSYVAIATHDEELIVAALDTIAELGLPREAYEFQMLLGVRGDLARLLAEGHTVRIYVPYGPDSYAYAQRRLRENPQLAGSVARDLLRKLARRARTEGAR